ncbi:hypothetical protein BS17DRAFT_881294, partial [Gyrodon lividus]
MSNVFNLSCWVRGTPVHTSFVIIVSKIETVNTLRQLIKESEQIDVPASALRLHKPRDPVSEPYDENLSSVILSELGKPLPPSRKLSALFAVPPPEEHIHIIVDAPSLWIYCWLRGSTIEDRFGISINSDARLEQLQDRMKEGEPQLKNVAQSRMRLYKVLAGDDRELQESL